MAELQPIIVFHGRHFVRHLGIYSRICVKLLQIMFGVIPRNLKKRRRLYLKLFSWGPQTRNTHTHTQIHRHTHTHDDSIRRNAMRCISPKNQINIGHQPHVEINNNRYLNFLSSLISDWMTSYLLDGSPSALSEKWLNELLPFRWVTFSTVRKVTEWPLTFWMGHIQICQKVTDSSYLLDGSPSALSEK